MKYSNIPEVKGTGSSFSISFQNYIEYLSQMGYYAPLFQCGIVYGHGVILHTDVSSTVGHWPF
jgi:hypothetical protein